MYFSVNPRSNSKTQKALMHQLNLKLKKLQSPLKTLQNCLQMSSSSIKKNVVTQQKLTQQNQLMKCENQLKMISILKKLRFYQNLCTACTFTICQLTLLQEQSKLTWNNNYLSKAEIFYILSASGAARQALL